MVTSVSPSFVLHQSLPGIKSQTLSPSIHRLEILQVPGDLLPEVSTDRKIRSETQI